jgi:hypothetical protein
VTLSPKFATTFSEAGPYQPVNGMFPFNPGLQATVRLMLAPYADINGLVQSIAALPEYRGSAPCLMSGTGTYTPLTDPAFDLVQAFAANKFIWAAGSWTLHFKITAGDQQDSLDKTFELSAADVERLRDSVKLVKSCQSINGTAPLGQDGATSNYLLR